MRNNPKFWAYVSLVAVCFFWGTTYLGIRMALESFSPFQLVSLRYIISGFLMLAGAAVSKAHMPRGRELWRTAFNGIVILGIGNGCLAFSEQWVPSGMAALFITTSPFWMAAIEALVPGGEPLHLPTTLGMLVGFAGVAFLVGPEGWAPGDHTRLIAGFFILQFGCAGWSLGSIWQRRDKTLAHPIVSGAVQQLATGIFFIVPALMVPHPATRVTLRSGLAVAYLITFGSIIGYSAYIYALNHLPVSVLSLYNYFNPMVAVFLGWLFYRERFGVRETIGMAVIFLGVAIVKRTSRKPTAEPPEGE